MTFTIDILQTELDGNLPHWLHPSQKIDRAAIRAKHRAIWAKGRAKEVRPETMARAQATYETIRAKDPAFDPETIAEAKAFNRHRRRTHLPPPEVDGNEEAAAWAKHRAKHSRPYVIFVAADPIDLPDGPTEVADIPVKLQLVAWSKAITVLDASEVIIRDLIERELAGKTGPTTLRVGLQAIPIANRLVGKIAHIRSEAIKTAFRLVRSRLGDVTVLDTSLAVWAKAFAKEDLNSIRTAIQAGIVDGLDSTEIARKVVGSMALKGVDGVTEFTRHKLAHLGRAAIKQSNLRKLRGE